MALGSWHHRLPCVCHAWCMNPLFMDYNVETLCVANENYFGVTLVAQVRMTKVLGNEVDLSLAPLVQFQLCTPRKIGKYLFL
jgi:hypothetical protein